MPRRPPRFALAIVMYVVSRNFSQPVLDLGSCARCSARAPSVARASTARASASSAQCPARPKQIGAGVANGRRGCDEKGGFRLALDRRFTPARTAVSSSSGVRIGAGARVLVASSSRGADASRWSRTTIATRCSRSTSATAGSASSAVSLAIEQASSIRPLSPGRSRSSTTSFRGVPGAATIAQTYAWRTAGATSFSVPGLTRRPASVGIRYRVRRRTWRSPRTGGSVGGVGTSVRPTDVYMLPAA